MTDPQVRQLAEQLAKIFGFNEPCDECATPVPVAPPCAECDEWQQKLAEHIACEDKDAEELRAAFGIKPDGRNLKEQLLAIATTPAPVSREPQFICRARKQGTAGGNDPADCDWPRCGCDPYANKVLDTIDESGFDIVPKPGVSREPISAEQWLEFARKWIADNAPAPVKCERCGQDMGTYSTPGAMASCPAAGFGVGHTYLIRFNNDPDSEARRLLQFAEAYARAAARTCETKEK